MIAECTARASDELSRKRRAWDELFGNYSAHMRRDIRPEHVYGSFHDTYFKTAPFLCNRWHFTDKFKGELYAAIFFCQGKANEHTLGYPDIYNSVGDIHHALQHCSGPLCALNIHFREAVKFKDFP